MITIRCVALPIERFSGLMSVEAADTTPTLASMPLSTTLPYNVIHTQNVDSASGSPMVSYWQTSWNATSSRRSTGARKKVARSGAPAEPRGLLGGKSSAPAGRQNLSRSGRASSSDVSRALSGRIRPLPESGGFARPSLHHRLISRALSGLRNADSHTSRLSKSP